MLFAEIELLQQQCNVNLSTNFMNRSSDMRTLRSGKIYGKLSHAKMYVSAENTADAPATRDPERTKKIPTESRST